MILVKGLSETFTKRRDEVFFNSLTHSQLCAWYSFCCRLVLDEQDNAHIGPVALLLAFSERVLAIGITTTGTDGRTVSDIYRNGFSVGQEIDPVPDGVDSFSSSTVANLGDWLISTADWNLTNTANQVSGNNTIINDPAIPGEPTAAVAWSSFEFSLSESVSYSLTGHFAGFQRPGSLMSLTAAITDVGTSMSIY